MDSPPPFRKQRPYPLHRAAKKGLVNVVATLINSGKDVNEKDRDKYTPLHHAVENNKYAVVKLLTKVEGIELDEKDNKGYTPFRLAVYKGHTDIVKLLIKTGRVDLKVKHDGRNMLFLATSLNHHELVKLLVYYDYFDINEKDKSGNTILHSVLTDRLFHIKPNTILPLINSGEIDLSIRNNDGKTPLHIAVERCLFDIVTAFTSVNRKFDINIRDNNGMTPLYLATKVTKVGNMDIVKILINNGANVNIVDNKGRSPLYCAIKQNNMVLVSHLLFFINDLNVKDYKDRTLLHYTVKYEADEISELLLSKGADYNMIDKNGRKPFD